MSAHPPEAGPLISVIIPCYNHGRYLPEALVSVRQQDYPAVEVLVVDDGSTDDTREVAQRHAEVKYFYQANQGLSAARNTGIGRSTGQFLVFLDADDWLLPGALQTNAHYLRQNPALAFVSGGHDKVYLATGLTKPEAQEVATDHYLRLLQGNYIGMHAAVMYQRWAFEELRYDPALRACEDYDVYLRIARAHPVAHHPRRVAAYRQHESNMSGNIPLMLTTALNVLQKQAGQLRSEVERQAYARGQLAWKMYYTAELYGKLLSGPTPPTPAELALLRAHRPALFFRYLYQHHVSRLKSLLKRHLPASGLGLLHKAGFYKGRR